MSARVNVTVEDSSPLISYSLGTGWVDSDSADSFLDSYSQSSVHSTGQPGATASFTFVGTSFWVVGALRDTHGQYQIAFDNGTAVTFNGRSATPRFRQVLAFATGFPLAEHTITMRNLDGVLDIDFIIYETEVPDGTDAVQTLDDSTPLLQYGPAPNMWQSSTNQTGYRQNTVHFTEAPGATCQLSFEGHSVAIYGSVSPSHNDYTVTVDGQSRTLSGTSSVPHLQTMLFHADNLGPGSHNVVLQNSAQGGFLDVDFVQVFGGPTISIPPPQPSVPVVPNPSSTNILLPGESRSDPKTTNSMSGLTIAGIVLGLVIGLALLVTIAIIIIRRKRRRSSPSTTQVDSPRKMEEAPDPPRPPVPVVLARAGSTASTSSNATIVDLYATYDKQATLHPIRPSRPPSLSLPSPATPIQERYILRPPPRAAV